MNHKELSRPISNELEGSADDEVKKLALLVAGEEGISREEVEAELKRVANKSKFGKPRGSVEIIAVVGLIVNLAHLAFLLAETDKTLEQLGAELQKKAESATKIAKERRDNVVKLIVANLPWLK
jgi:hypothetical protein